MLLQGTLVLVPPHLMNQWPSEICKFTGDALKVEVIKTVGDLGRISVKQVIPRDGHLARLGAECSARHATRSQRLFATLAPRSRRRTLSLRHPASSAAPSITRGSRSCPASGGG